MADIVTPYEGLYGEKELRPESEWVFSERIGSRSEHKNWKILPHFHVRLFQILLVEEGAFVFSDNRTDQNLSGPTVIFIPPSCIHAFYYKLNTKGTILTITESIIESVIPQSILSSLAFSAPRYVSALQTVCFMDELLATVNALNKEIFSTLPERQVMQKSLIMRIFIIFYRMYGSDEKPISLPHPLPDRTWEHFREIQKRIREAGAVISVADLSRDMSLSQVHLNRICRAIVGKSVGALIHDYLLDAARSYLTYTSYSVKEIAYLLNFQYANYFARFFHAGTGLTPSQYRKSRRLHQS